MWICSEKDMKKDTKEDESTKPKRSRGRPRKIKIMNEELINNDDNNNDDDSSSMEEEE